MKSLLVHPFGNIPSKEASHKGAQAYIYADQLGVTDILTKDLKLDNYDDYDIVYVYHGNDWSGSLNVFGGIEFWAGMEPIRKLAEYKGNVQSIKIPFPEYSDMIKDRLKSAWSRDKEYDKRWDTFPWDKLKKIEERTPPLDPNFVKPSRNLSIGDSHAICMYRPGWRNVSIPYSTLFGSLKEGFDRFIPKGDYDIIETYFGNIDIRHHLLRQPNPNKAATDLAKRYVEEVIRIREKHDVRITIWEPLPIENESRKIPKTGYYKGEPFFGSWAERDCIRRVLVERLKEYTRDVEGISIYEWVDPLMNSKGELDFQFMEKPRSVHLSRAAYPLWKKDVNEGLEGFFE